MDWFSRYVLAWRLSNSLEVHFCLEALEEALGYGSPDIYNTDQGAQFTSPKHTGKLKQAEVKISMDGRGRCLDNIFIERLWRTVKYEEVYLKDYQDGREAQESLKEYFSFYNRERSHASLQKSTPEAVYLIDKERIN